MKCMTIIAICFLAALAGCQTTGTAASTDAFVKSTIMEGAPVVPIIPRSPKDQFPPAPEENSANVF